MTGQSCSTLSSAWESQLKLELYTSRSQATRSYRLSNFPFMKAAIHPHDMAHKIAIQCTAHGEAIALSLRILPRVLKDGVNCISNVGSGPRCISCPSVLSWLQTCSSFNASSASLSANTDTFWLWHRDESGVKGSRKADISRWPTTPGLSLLREYMEPSDAFACWSGRVLVFPRARNLHLVMHRSTLAPRKAYRLTFNFLLDTWRVIALAQAVITSLSISVT